jgi:PhnB protein
MIQISPYLSFNGRCREAMTFYQECFGGELTVQTIGETPLANNVTGDLRNQIIHSMLSNGSFLLMATDMIRPGEQYKPGNDIAISLNFGSEDELRRCFTELAAGGKILDPVQKQFWGGIFGVVQDKFGKVWMMNYQKDQS